MSANALAERLAVQDLALAFGGNQVLQDIAVNFEPGEITGLIGPNGAGKTSFFNCLTGKGAVSAWAGSASGRCCRRSAPRSAFRAASSMWRCARSSAWWRT